MLKSHTDKAQNKNTNKEKNKNSKKLKNFQKFENAEFCRISLTAFKCQN